MIRLRIRARVLLLALLPMIAVSVLISVYFVLNRIHDLDVALRNHGQAIARQLAPACEYGVFSGNRAILASLVRSTSREADVWRVTIRDSAGEVLAQATRGEPGPGIEPLVFEAPILHHPLPAADEFSGEPAGTTLREIGRVRVELTGAGTHARQREMLVESMLILLVGLLVTAALAWRIGLGIALPVIRLTRAVEDIRKGNLDQRVPVVSHGELGILESGINAMAEGLALARQRDQQRADDLLYQEQARAQVTLASIGDGVITTDSGGYVQYMNPVAEELTGWTLADAEGLALVEVFKVIDERIGQERDYPLHVSLRDGRILRHENRHALLRKDGRRFSIQDSAAPIRDRDGRVLGAVVVFHDTTEMQHLVSRMTFLASHDSLTGLLNRHEFELRLQQALESARLGDRRHAMCYLDLDQFKIVNDTCGHVAGDELLKQLTHRLHGRMRTHDVLARLGGDEFGVILHDCELDTAYRLADELRQVVRDYRFAWQDRSFEIGVSIGLVPIVDDSGSMTDVLSAADSACYVAKDLGRNRVHIYQVDDAVLARRHGEMRWVQRIQDGLDNGRFHLYGQRIEPLAGEGASMCEILLRLEEAGRATIVPSAFIPAAERYYLMPTIDRWVVARALALIGATRASTVPGRPALYAINLSGQSLCDEQFADFVAEHLERSGVDPGILCFEITETAAVANLMRAIGFIERFKALGCRFALDDFGSGLSSFGYLKSLPVDYLKIAGNFILDINVDPVDYAMVDAINQIGHVMGLATIAESAEDASVLARLRTMGIDYAQGFGLHHPQPLETLLRGE